MWTYIARRLLLMIPTLFGVTVVSFLIMQLAPGDPLLTQLDQSGAAGQSTQTRESFLLQKRDLNLDKSVLLNFRNFYNYVPIMRAAAHFRALSQAQLARELASLAGPKLDEDDLARLRFLRSLGIRDFDARLADADLRERFAKAVEAQVQTYCEDVGIAAVPATVALLHDPKADRRQKIGAVRALNSMVVEPFVFTYSRTPTDEQTPSIQETWKLWWDRAKKSFPEVDPARRAELTEKLSALGGEPSRQKVFEEVEQLDHEDTPFFMERLLGSGPLSDKVIAATFLVLYNSKPLKADVAVDASEVEASEAAANWLAHYDSHRDRYELGTARKVWSIVADTQYAHMIVRLVTFDFGRSALKSREPVSRILWRAVAVSAPLMVMSELFIYLVAVPLGILCAVNRGNLVDRLTTLALFLLYSIPAFVAGMLFLLFLCYGDYVKWFPTTGLHSDEADKLGLAGYLLDYFWHAALPITCLSLFSLAGMAMYSRTSMLDVIAQDYVRTARAKGLSPSKVILKHALRNGLIPIITLFSNFLPAMLGGAVLMESLFSIPGMGRLSIYSIDNKDYPTMMALIYVDAIVVLLSILMTDLLYVLVDPRISFESQDRSV